MASKLPGIVNPSDAFTEDVLKCIKDTLKQKSGQFTYKHDGSRAFIRNDEFYVTGVEDDVKAWKGKFKRRANNLQYGFFADKAKPYQALGEVYLESGDLILHSLTDDLKRKIAKLPEKSDPKWGKVARSKKGAPEQKSLPRARMIEKLDIVQSTAGYFAIKQRLDEVRAMRRGVHAAQSLSGYLVRKEQEAIEEKNRKDDRGMRPPLLSQWKVVRNAGKLLGKKPKKSRVSPSGLRAEIEELSREDAEELLKWKNVQRVQYVQNKLQAVNSLLCCLYNMKSRLLKLQTTLSGRTVVELLRQDVALDQHGKPAAYRGALVTDDWTAFSDGSNTPEAGERNQKPVSASSNVTNALDKKRGSTTAFSSSSPRKPRLVQLASKFAVKGAPEPSPTPRLETWEDLLAAGERNKKLSYSKPPGYGGKYGKGHSTPRRVGTAVNTAESQLPWTTIAQTEKAIEEKRKMSMLGSISRRTAEDILRDIRHEFAKMQKKISKTVEDDLARRKGERFKHIQNKFNTINYGPVSRVSLEKMRHDAAVMTRNMRDNTSQPMPWFVDLKAEVRNDTEIEDDMINHIIKKVSRFQFEDCKEIPYAKEKLCLLVMSMPAHLLMNASMKHAILFVLAKVLSASPELLDVWLYARKLASIRRVETSATPGVPEYL